MNNPNNKAWEPIVTNIQIEIKYKWKLKKSFERVFRLFSFSTNCHLCDNAIVCANICWIFFFHRQFNTQLPIWIKRIIPPFLFQFTSIRDNRYSRMFIHYIDFTVDCTIFLPSPFPFLRTYPDCITRNEIFSSWRLDKKKKKICQSPCVRLPNRAKNHSSSKGSTSEGKKKKRTYRFPTFRHPPPWLSFKNRERERASPKRKIEKIVFSIFSDEVVAIVWKGISKMAGNLDFDLYRHWKSLCCGIAIYLI